jgi:hypothetical protein
VGEKEQGRIGRPGMHQTLEGIIGMMELQLSQGAQNGRIGEQGPYWRGNRNIRPLGQEHFYPEILGRQAGGYGRHVPIIGVGVGRDPITLFGQLDGKGFGLRHRIQFLQGHLQGFRNENQGIDLG